MSATFPPPSGQAIPQIPAIDTLLLERRVIITCGTGGVGKTTLSAAMALRAALLGRNVLVITIDPAKRLATSLGMKDLGDQPHDLTALLQEALKKSSAQVDRSNVPTEVRGRLSALMPDTRRTFEDFIRGLAPRPEIADRVIHNPIFEIFTREFSGTNEYMALKRLYLLDQKRDYDLIILDTPPSRNTLAFLDAPKLLTRLFEEKIIKWLMVPANKIVAAGMKKALGMLEKLTGAGFMHQLMEFAAALFEVRVSFAENLKSVTRLLESRDVGFVMVASASPENSKEAAQFIQILHDHRFHFDGIALNRTLTYLGPANPQQANQPEPIRKGLELLSALQSRETDAIQSLLNQSQGKILVQLPELARDVHSMEDLCHVAIAMGG